MEKNTYKITKNSIDKIITIEAGELTSQEAAGRFINEYRSKVNSVNASEYTLQIDCRKMKVVDQSISKSLEDAFELYKQSGFNNVVFFMGGSAVQKMQYSRLARTVGLNAEFVQ